MAAWSFPPKVHEFPMGLNLTTLCSSYPPTSQDTNWTLTDCNGVVTFLLVGSQGRSSRWWLVPNQPKIGVGPPKNHQLHFAYSLSLEWVFIGYIVGISPYDSWWLNHTSEKVWVKLDHFPNSWGENKTYLKPPTSFLSWMPCTHVGAFQKRSVTFFSGGWGVCVSVGGVQVYLDPFESPILPENPCPGNPQKNCLEVRDCIITVPWIC